MAKIEGIDGMTPERLQTAVARGGKFVYFPYVISVVVMTFRRSSPILFLQPGESAVVKGLPYLFLTFLLGWWGIPWGIIRTPMALVTILRGGIDVTYDVMASLMPAPTPIAAAPYVDNRGPGNPW